VSGKTPNSFIRVEGYDYCASFFVANPGALADIADCRVFFGADGLLPHFLFRAAAMARAAVLIVFLLGPIQPRAQDSSSGAIRGSVNDASGGRVAGASIVLVNDATAFRYSTVSDTEGRFAFDLLPPGDYTARAVAAGMSPQLTPKVHILVGGILEVEFKLLVAGAKESITVTGEPPLVETEPCSETTGLYTKPELKPTERLPVRTFTEAEDQFRRPGAFLSRLPPINGIGRPTGQKISKKIRRSSGRRRDP